MHDPTDSKAPHKFHASEADRLLDPRRTADVTPADLLAALEVRPGDHIGDLGCGNGFWLEHLMDLAPEGVRFEAVDVSPGMLQALKDRLSRHRRWTDVTLHRSEESRIPLEDGLLVGACLINVHHELDDRVAFLREVLRVLAPGGRLVLVDWAAPPEGAVPDRGPPGEHRVPRNIVVRELAEAGFQDIRPLPTSRDFYGLVGRRPLP